MEYVIGIDGGGTKTHLLAVDKNMDILYESKGGSSNLASNPPEVVKDNLSSLLEEFRRESGLSPLQCRGLCLGSAGAGRESAKKTLYQFLQKSKLSPYIYVTTDAEGALYGGTETGCGLLLIAGTGSICYGRNAVGEICRVGGWGHIMGDEGSGFNMACRMLQAVAKAWDGRGRPTILTDLIMEYWSLHNMDELVDYVYHANKGKAEIAALAFLCDLAYKKGDESAFEIMEACARELAGLVKSAGRAFSQDSQVICVYSGSLITKSLYLLQHLRHMLAENTPEILFIQPKQSAAWGCARLAWELQSGK